MARIPEVEVERLKREVSLLRLLEGQGHALVKQGRDLPLPVARKRRHALVRGDPKL